MLRLSYFSKTNLGEVYEFIVTGRSSHHIKNKDLLKFTTTSSKSHKRQY